MSKVLLCDSQMLQYQHNDIIITVSHELLTCVRKLSFFCVVFFDEIDFAADERFAVAQFAAV